MMNTLKKTIKFVDLLMIPTRFERMFIIFFFLYKVTCIVKRR